MKNMMYLRKSVQIHRAALFKWLVENRRKGLAKKKKRYQSATLNESNKRNTQKYSEKNIACSREDYSENRRVYASLIKQAVTSARIPLTASKSIFTKRKLCTKEKLFTILTRSQAIASFTVLPRVITS